MDLGLEGKAVVVTGGSKGIGLAIVETLVAEGARVLVASRSRGPGLNALGAEVAHLPVDLMDPQAPAQAVAAADERFSGVDILINNAGGPPPDTVLPRFGFLTAQDADWQSMFEFNLFSAVRACRAAIPLMVARGGGVIVNISSGHACQPSSVNVDYGAAKAALRNLTVALSEEFAPEGIRVNSVTPGPVRTPWWTEPGGAADVLAQRLGSIREDVLETEAPTMMNLTTGRLIEPQEVADVVALLASPRSASTTGADFVVDAGWIKGI